MDKPKEKKTGIKCRHCKGHMRAYYTIPKKGHIIRGRQCIKCGFIKQTTEK